MRWGLCLRCMYVKVFWEGGDTSRGARNMKNIGILYADFKQVC